MKQSDSKSGGFKINRRTFLKGSAFTIAAISLSRVLKRPGAGTTPNRPPTDEGVNTEKWVSTSCLNCPTRCAIRVRVVNGKAVHIMGNPLSAVSEGQICPRGHVGLQVLYDPARVRTPLKRTNELKGRGVDPGWTSISWEQALSEVSSKLKAIRSKGQPQNLLLLHGLNATSDEDMLYRFATAYGTPNIVSGDALEDEATRVGRWLADGNYSYIAYDMGQTNYILSFGASIVESAKPLARNLRMWGKIRRERPTRAKVVVIDPRYSVTAARADEWLPIKPGTDAALAMAITNVIISEKLYDTQFVQDNTNGFNTLQELVFASYDPKKVADTTGIDADTIRRIAREFASTRPAIAWAGKGAAAWPGGSYASYAIFCLNALVGSIDVPGGVIYQEAPPYRALPAVEQDDIARAGLAQSRLDLTPLVKQSVAVNRVADSINQGFPYPVEMAIGVNSNFNMTAPGASRWDSALKKVPYYVHIAPFASEMADYADILLPSPVYLEQWGYDHSPPGSGFAEIKLKQPAVAPLYSTKTVTDIIFALAGSLGGSTSKSFTGIGDDTQGFVKFRTGGAVPWSDLTDRGIWSGGAYEYRKYSRIFNTPSRKFDFLSGNLQNVYQATGRKADYANDFLPHQEALIFMGDEAHYPLMLITYDPVLHIQNGSQNYPWAQESYLVMHGRGWENFAVMNTETAKKLGVNDLDWVWVTSPTSQIKIRARVTEGIYPGVVAIASGQGHRADGQWQKGIGVNPNDVIGVSYDGLSGQSTFFNTRVRVSRA